MEIRQCIFTQNDCYKAGRTIKPKRIIVHSTGANNKKISRYVQPNDGLIGVNKYNNHWNRTGVNTCVHAFIGTDANGEVRVYQTLPWTMRAWGCGSGKRGSYNDDAIQFEICEDALKDEKYFTEAFNKAVELCVFLCKEYDIPVSEVISHHEAHARGYASNHADCDHWLNKFAKGMDWFRSKVTAKLNGHEEEEEESVGSAFLVKVTASALNIRSGASALSKKVGVIKDKGTYTIVEVKGNWGKLKSGAGWISLNYTKRV